MTIRDLLILTAVIALSVALVMYDRFTSLVTPMAIFLGVATVFHNVSVYTSSSRPVRNTLIGSILPALVITWCLMISLPDEYQNIGWLGQGFLLFVFLFTVVLLFGKSDRPKQQGELELPEELLEALESDPKLSEAFHGLTPGRKKSYVINFNSAKQPETRISRIAKFRDKIIAGKGAMER